MRQKIRDLHIWKKRWVWVLTAVFAVLFLFCAVKLVLPNKEYQYSGAYTFTVEDISRETYVYQGISLPFGTYRVELDYMTDTDLTAWCNVWDGTVFTGALRCNGEHLYRGLTKTEYEMWLYEGTDDMRVMLTYNGNGSLETGNLKIVETNQMWTMLMTMILFGAAVTYAMIIFYYYDRSYMVSKEKKNAFFFITLIVFIASLPYLCGFNITGADLTYHLQRIEGVKDGLLTGQFPVRLEPKWVYNHGYANGIFYCNALLYFPAILRLLGFTITASYNAYCIALNLATAWIAYYCFSRMFKSSNIGVVCSALYTLSIFRIYKLLITSAVGEGSAVTFMPLVIYGLYRIFTEDTESPKYKTSWIPLMLGYAGLIQTHVLTCEITAFVTIVFCVMNIRKFLCKNVWWEFIKGAMGAAALTLWYLVPFLDYYITQDVHIKHVSGRTIQDRGLLFAQLAFHFWRDGDNTPLGNNGMQNSHPVGIGFILIAVLAVFLIMWFSGAFRKAEEVSISFVKKAAIMGFLLLVMSLNFFPWDKIQFMNSITASLVSSLQFPNRFLGWGTVCLVMVFGFMLWYFKKYDVKLFWVMAAVAFLGVTTSSMYLLDSVKANQDFFELYNEESMGFGYISGAEYLIEGTQESLLTFTGPEASQGVEISGYVKCGLGAKFLCANENRAEGYVDLPILLYKGYRAYDASGQELEVSVGENNLVRLEIPAGYDGNVAVRFVSPVYWRIAEAVTFIGMAVLLIIWAKYRRMKHVEEKAQ